jgi:ankyrin repeat protein
MGLAINSFFADVRRGDLAAVKRALGRQAGVLHARAGSEQRTPLHIAADIGNHLVLRTLLQNGADYTAADSAGEVPLMLAARQVGR